MYAVYAPAVAHEFIHDDRQLILRQQAPDSLLEVAKVFGEPHWPGLPYYRPVTRATMVAQKYWHGDDPAPYHRFNIALICGAALVFFGILRGRPFELGFAPSLLAAAVFAVHPVASGTVYPICSGRETLLPSLLMLCAIRAYLAPGAAGYGLALLFAALSLFAKEQAAVLPGIFFLADALGLTADPPGRSLKRWALRYLPLVLLFAFYFAIRSQLFGGALHHVSVLDRPLLPLWSLVYTLQTSLVPFAPLLYEPRFEVWWSPARAAVTGLLVVAAGVALARAAAPRRAQAAFLAGWWLVALLPTANLLVQESPFAERYGFLSLAGLLGVPALLASDAWPARGPRMAIAATAIAFLALSAWITVGRGPHFANEVAFAEQWVRGDPGSYKAQLNRGQGFVETGDWEAAVEHLGVASRLRPRSALIHNGLAYALWRNGDVSGATRHFERAIRLLPDFTIARLNYVDLLLSTGDAEAAARHAEHVLQRVPGDPRARRQLAKARRLRDQP